MTDVIIHPAREKGEPLLPEQGLLVVNASEAKYAAQLASDWNGRQHFLYNSKLFQVEGEKANSFFMAGPAVGAPMAVLSLEKLIVLGAKRLLVYGWCGSLSNEVTVGDVLLPTWAISEEGTSRHYPVKGRPESSTSIRKFLLDSLQKAGKKVVEAPMWTTDAPYRETREKVDKYALQGVMGVDMEFAALCTVAAFRKVEMAAVMLVSDELTHTDWKSGFRNKDFREGSRQLVRILAECCQMLPVY